MTMVRNMDVVKITLFRGYKNLGNIKAKIELSSSKGHLKTILN